MLLTPIVCRNYAAVYKPSYNMLLSAVIQEASTLCDRALYADTGHTIANDAYCGSPVLLHTAELMLLMAALVLKEISHR